MTQPETPREEVEAEAQRKIENSLSLIYKHPRDVVTAVLADACRASEAALAQAREENGRLRTMATAVIGIAVVPQGNDRSHTTVRAYCRLCGGTEWVKGDGVVHRVTRPDCPIPGIAALVAAPEEKPDA